MRLFKRGHSWYIEFERGKKRSLRTGDEREARRLFKLAKAEYLRDRLIRLEDESRITLSEYRDRFLAKRSDLAGPTLRMDA